MPRFPSSEAEIVALAQQMVAGYTAHATDFPGVTVADLSTALSDYQTAKAGQEEARGQALIGTEAKDNALTAMLSLMKTDLKISEVDVEDDPEKLALIGWGPKAPPTPIIAPGAPTELRPTSEGPGDVTLEWKKPTDGGPIRNYVVQRRQAQTGGEFGPWALIDFAYDTLVTMTSQPQGVRMEYRIKAANPAGESLPSNAAIVVL